MIGIRLKHCLASVVVAGLLAAQASASAGTGEPGVIAYNGHAGLGASAYLHNHTELLAFSPRDPGSGAFWLGSNDALAAAVTDGTSNTIAFAERAAGPRRFPVDAGTSQKLAASDDVVVADMGGQFY